MEKYATMSFEEKRAALLKAAERQGRSRGVSKQVEFDDKEIADFLRQYQEFQQKSRSTIIIAR